MGCMRPLSVSHGLRLCRGEEPSGPEFYINENGAWRLSHTRDVGVDCLLLGTADIDIGETPRRKDEQMTSGSATGNAAGSATGHVHLPSAYEENTDWDSSFEEVDVPGSRYEYERYERDVPGSRHHDARTCTLQ